MLRYAEGPKLISPIFLFSTVHVFYIYPKIIAFTLSNNAIGIHFRNLGTDFYVALSSTLCFLSFILGYRLFAKPSRALLPFLLEKREEKNLFRFSLFLGSVGAMSSAALAMRNGGLAGFYFGGGFYQMGFLGINVWLIFLSRFIYPAIAAAMLLLFDRPSINKIIYVAILCAFPLLNIAVLFRRSDLLFLTFIALYATIYVRRVRLRRAAITALTLCAFFTITLFPYMRQDLIASATNSNSEINDISFSEKVQESFEITMSDEVVRAASTISEIEATGNIRYGTFLWNSLVDQFIPSTLVGPGFKNSLKISLDYSASNQNEYFDREKYFYLAPMGFADAYVQFGIFGFVIFLFFGLLVARVERSSNKLSNRLFLILAIPLLCLAATNDVGSMPARLATFWVLSRFVSGSTKFRSRSDSLAMS